MNLYMLIIKCQENEHQTAYQIIHKDNVVDTGSGFWGEKNTHIFVIIECI